MLLITLEAAIVNPEFAVALDKPMPLIVGTQPRELVFAVQYGFPPYSESNVKLSTPTPLFGPPNVILILTSNLGAGGTEEQVMAAVRSAFKPEFINRLDDVIIFDALNPEELVSIVDIQLQQLAKRLAARRLTLEVSLPAKKWLAERGFDPLYGARPLRRLIQQAIGDQLAKLLLAGDVHDGDVVPVNVTPDGDGLVLG